MHQLLSFVFHDCGQNELDKRKVKFLASRISGLGLARPVFLEPTGKDGLGFISLWLLRLFEVGEQG